MVHLHKTNVLSNCTSKFTSNWLFLIYLNIDIHVIPAKTIVLGRENDRSQISPESFKQFLGFAFCEIKTLTFFACLQNTSIVIYFYQKLKQDLCTTCYENTNFYLEKSFCK